MNTQSKRNLPQPDAANEPNSFEKSRKLRQLRYPSASASGRDESSSVQIRPESPDDESEERRLTSGAKLTAVQRQIVLRLLAEYDNIPMVLAILQSDYPDIPIMSDRTLRTYQAQRRQVIDELAIESSDEAFTTGLAQRGQRIRHLTYQYNRLLARQARDDRRALEEGRDISLDAEAITQMRLLLEQIAVESGGRTTVARQSPRPASTSSSGAASTVYDATTRAEIEESIDRLIEEREAMRRADMLGLSLLDNEADETSV